MNQLTLSRTTVQRSVDLYHSEGIANGVLFAFGGQLYRIFKFNHATVTSMKCTRLLELAVA